METNGHSGGQFASQHRTVDQFIHSKHGNSKLTGAKILTQYATGMQSTRSPSLSALIACVV